MPRRSNNTPRQSEGPKKRIEGVIQVNRRGTGYLPWPIDERLDGKLEREDLEIPTEHLKGALNGDTIEAELIGLGRGFRGKPGRMQASVVRIKERAKTEFVCTVRQAHGKPGGLEVIADDTKFYLPIRLKGEVPADGTKLLVRLIDSNNKEARCEVIELIGKAGEHRVEMNAIVLEHGFATSFSPEVEAQAAQLERNHQAILAEELPKRADFRDLPTMTIDPLSAKDFDDALSLRVLPDGTYEVGVHIADASFFAKPGTPIGDEAARRGTSVYLVDATIPMLPHALSSNIASLMPGEDRLAFSAMFVLDKHARVLSRRFTKSVIRSDKRFTYEEAQQVLDTQAGPYLAELNAMYALAKEMRDRRSTEGAIDFGDNEVKFELDESGRPLTVVRKVRIDTNWLIEEFMLLANREVATYVSELAAKVPERNYVFLYRIHDEPKVDRIEELATFVRAVGYDFGHATKKHRYTARDISRLLEQIDGKPEQHLIRTATLRSMAKAIYSTRNIGHFGLAFEYYTHFTSPIRRYPDMLVHRILESHLTGKPFTKREFDNLERLCIAASEQEAKAVSAERDSIRYKLVEYMLPKIGQTFEAVVSGVTDWGLYVEEKESSAEGLVRVKTIGDDFYNYSQKEYALVGERTKKKYALGDPVRVKLVAADLATRQLDFELA